jgi:exodeoxyribonuclease-3
VASVYAPDGNPAPGPKFDYKLRWLQRFDEYASGLLSLADPVVVCGDYNIVPTEIDAVVPQRWTFDAVYFPESRSAYARLLDQGWLDAIRKLYPDKGVYTYWNFAFHGGYDKSSGLRMDHHLLNPSASRLLKAGGVNEDVRGWDKPSDHAPAWIELTSGR